MSGAKEVSVDLETILGKYGQEEDEGGWWEEEEDGVNYFDQNPTIPLQPDPAENLHDFRAKIHKFNQVHPRMWIGGDDYQYESKVMDRLRHVGVTHVLDCRSHGELEDAINSGSFTHPQSVFEFAANHGDDNGRPKPIRYWDFTFRWAKKVLEDPQAKLYVHCAMGINRGPSNGYAILRACFGMTSKQALTAIRTNRPAAGVIYWRDVDQAVQHYFGRTSQEEMTSHGF